MKCLRCEHVELELLTAAEGSRAAGRGGAAIAAGSAAGASYRNIIKRIAVCGGAILAAGAAILVFYGLGLSAKIRDPSHDSMGLFRPWEGCFAFMVFAAAAFMLIGSLGLFFWKSKAKGARRCPSCGTIYELGPNGTLMPLN